MTPGKPSRQNLKEDNGAFDSCITSLIEEIALSIKWDRPSILLAVYPSEVIRMQGQTALEKQISSLGYKVTYIKVDKENFDLAWFLSQFDQHKQVVFFISGLRWGGGRSRTNAYQALNLRRELFVSEKMRLVIWMNPLEATNLPIHAPDFWAFRHRVVEFPEQSPNKKTDQLNARVETPERHDLLSWRDWQINETAERINEKIVLRESLLAGMPVEKASNFMRTELMYTLAYLYWSKGSFEKAGNYLDQALAIAKQPEGKPMRSKILVAMGILYHDRGNLEIALQRYNKVLETDPENSHCLNNLGRLYMDSGKKEEALDAFKLSTKLDSKNSNAWNNLGNYYRLNGKFEKALDAYKKSAKLEPMLDIPLINTASAHLDLGQPDKAIRALKKANRIDPSNVVTLMKLGNIYLGMNRFKDARTSYNKANKEDSTYFPAYIGLITCENLLKKPKAANKHLSEAMEIYKNQNEVMQAAFEVQRGNHKEAIQLLNKALNKGMITPQGIRTNPFFDPLQGHHFT
ncbi:MAG: tetratricopeptide repeat protein [Anaerolineales bacterium]